MMMAQPFPAHQGIPQHSGLPPGHPMAHAQHPNAAHPGAGIVQQVHPGVSGPGGPQMAQAGPMMGGMPPGAATTGPGGPVPNAHAMSHLGPTQAQIFQQPQFAQNFANNPQALHHQQQQVMRQRFMLQQQQHQQQQQQQQQQQHQQQHGGIPVSLPNGAQGLTPAQIAAMQGNPGMRPVNLQMGLQQMPHGQPMPPQQQQFLALQQAQQVQAQQAQQAQHAGTPGQPGQHNPQQRATAQPPSIHEAQSVTPQPQPGPPPHQGSATPQPNPPQPPSSQPPAQQGGIQPQPTPNPPSQQLPHSQQPMQQPQHTPRPPSQPQPQPHPGGPQGPQQGPQHPTPMTAQEAQLKAQQHQSQAALLMQQQQQQQQQRMGMKNMALLCLNTFADHLSNFKSRDETHDLLYWQTFVDRFYAPGGVLRQGVYNPQSGAKQFEVSTPALARYYLTQFTSGIRQIQMLVEGARESPTPNGGHTVESPRTSFIYWFTNDTQLFTNGTLVAHFDANNKIEILDIVVINHTEYLPRNQLQALEQSEQQKQSPKVSKNMGKRGQQKQPNSPTTTLPESMVTNNGVPIAVMSFLEVAETISQMQMLFQFSQQNPQMSPPEALRNLVNTFQTQNPNPGLVPGPMNPALQPGQPPRGPLNGPGHFASPAMHPLGLPGAQGSPHLANSAQPSPAPSHLTAPGMVPQGQVQHNVHSASASPNVSGNKRRRASTVKVEGDETGSVPEVNGVTPQGGNKIKASPRVGNKKQKGTT